jgi:hypothetical protein
MRAKPVESMLKLRYRHKGADYSIPESGFNRASKMHYPGFIRRHCSLCGGRPPKKAVAKFSPEAPARQGPGNVLINVCKKCVYAFPAGLPGVRFSGFLPV